MTIRRHLIAAVLLLFVLACSNTAFAQLAPLNDVNATLGHMHIAVKDVEAQKKIWTTILGGTLVTNGPLTMVQFPGIYILFRQADSVTPAANSVADHFGLVYKDIAAEREKWKAAGIKYDVGEVNHDQGYIYLPDSDLRVEVFGDPSLPGRVSFDHIHMFPGNADIAKMQEWYTSVFGGMPGKRKRVAAPGVIEVVYFLRFNMSFGGGANKRTGSKGTSFDHIGFDVASISEFEKHLASKGLKFDAPPRQVEGSKARIAFLTDPWGTYIEVTEHLEP